MTCSNKQYSVIQIRRGSSAEFVASNPVLASGEPAIAIDSKEFKIGDGVTPWIDLLPPFVSGVVSGIFGPSSGCCPIQNYANNRLLTNDGSETGIYAESNLTFDGNLLSVSGNLIARSGTLNTLSFDLLANSTLNQGQIGWNDTYGTLDLGFTSTYAMHVGEETHFRIRNESGNILYKGQPVYASGIHNDNKRLLVTPYVANGTVREVRFIGLMTETVLNNGSGYTTNFGYINAVDTRGNVASDIAVGDETWNTGDILYVHPTVAGKLTKVEPKHSISVAIVMYVHQNNGLLLVRPTSYGHLDDIHDVNISGATNGQFLQYNSSTDYWVPSNSGNFSSLSVNNSPVSVSGHTHVASNITDIAYIPTISLGTVSGSGFINAGYSNSIQTLTLNGSGVTFVKGTGWPTSNDLSTDVVLRMNVTAPTAITWTIATDRFNQPPAGALGVGTHVFVLRGVGTSIVESHYVGSKTN
jgi:hypothetical protein